MILLDSPNIAPTSLLSSRTELSERICYICYLHSLASNNTVGPQPHWMLPFQDDLTVSTSSNSLLSYSLFAWQLTLLKQWITSYSQNNFLHLASRLPLSPFSYSIGLSIPSPEDYIFKAPGHLAIFSIHSQTKSASSIVSYAVHILLFQTFSLVADSYISLLTGYLTWIS